jgi:shikimate dehydrogenase
VKIYGLIGKSLIHSFSPGYFQAKFEKEKISNCDYKLFQLNSINEFQSFIENNPDLAGLNVTIPYKQSIIKYLDRVDFHAERIGAVNTIKIDTIGGKRVLTGFNTDFLGFTDSLKPLIHDLNKNALILGTGGSSAAIAYALQKLNINYLFVSRNPKNSNEIDYKELNEDVITSHNLIINTTPLGMFPDISGKPEIPYQYITSNHILFDLVYNPEETMFLKIGQKQGAKTKNGFEMLGIQAEYSWKIWNDL